MAMNKRKKTTAIVAGVTAAALLLGGTFAWTSISQQAKNEAIVDINPGGRLHDDFDGTNKDVYVENFSSGATGVNIFARIRLDQYFEVGQDAGINKDASERKVTKPLGDNTDINDESTWVTYKPVADEAGNIDLSNPIQANDNWQWTLGNDDDNMPYYMPTFNKNKDSLAADINGTYEGTVEGDIVHYDDFVKYGSADEATTDTSIVSSITGNATYDWDEDTDEDYNSETSNENDPIDSADVLKKEETHNATQISTTATVISMADWIALYNDDIEGNETGNFWVYDADGWAYWAQPIAPETTTGLLLDGINMSRVPDDNWYYGINVVGQFATASDWEMFYTSTDEGGAGEDEMTPEAKQLMALITDTAASGDNTGDTYQELVLDADNTNSVSAAINEGIKITTEDENADLSSVNVYYLVSDEEGATTETYLTEDQYSYADGILTITDSSLESATSSLTVTDATKAVSGSLEIDYSHDVDNADYISIGQVPMQDGYDGTNTVYGTEGYMKPGDYMQLTASATVDGVDNSDIIVSDEDVWTIEGATSANTTVDENGKLTIASDESTTLHLITVKVTYKGLEATDSYYVSGGLTATITPMENVESYTAGTTYQFTFSVVENGTDITDQFANWNWGVSEVGVDGFSYGTENATIDENGNFTATAAGTYVISASADYYFGPELEITVIDVTE